MAEWLNCAGKISVFLGKLEEGFGPPFFINSWMKKLIEMPITGWNNAPDMEEREKEMVSKIKLNHLPEQISDDEILTTDPIKLAKIDRIMKEFQRDIIKVFDRALRKGEGKIFMI